MCSNIMDVGSELEYHGRWQIRILKPEENINTRLGIVDHLRYSKSSIFHYQ